MNDESIITYKMKNNCKDRVSQAGIVTIEYAFAMLVMVGAVTAGMPYLFEACDVVLAAFVEYMQPSYP